MGSSSSSSDRLKPGDLVAGRFKVVRQIGEGGMGTVLEVEHLVTSRRLAMKVMRDLDEEVVQRFMREARAACAVRHPAVLPVHDVFAIDQGGLVIVMDLLKGSSLEDLIEQRGRLSVQDAIDILVPIASALGAAHESGIIHRDVKPANVFVTTTGEPYLLDFGIAKHAASAGPTLTDHKAAIGTPAYMSPEQAFGNPVDRRTDVWSFGLTLYEALTGELPTLAEAPGRMYEKIRRADFPLLRDIAPDVPERLATLVHAMLVAEPRSRVGSMSAVYDAMMPFARQERTLRYPRPAGAGAAIGSVAPMPAMPRHDVEHDTLLTPKGVASSSEMQTGLTSTTTTQVRARGDRMAMIGAGALLLAGAAATAFYLAVRPPGAADSAAVSPRTGSETPVSGGPAVSTGAATVAPEPTHAAPEPTVIVSASPEPVISSAKASARPVASSPRTAAPHVVKTGPTVTTATPTPTATATNTRGGLF